MIKILFPLLLLAGCATSPDTEITCKEETLQSCQPSYWPGVDPVCAILVDAETQEPVVCK